jgi:pyruvate,water dikinase
MLVPPADAFVPPAPGAWELERTHTTRPVSGFMAEAFPRGMMRGFRESTGAYSALLDYFDVAVLHRFVYMCPRPVGAPKGAKGPPPRALFALLRRVHPEIRRRIAGAERVFRDRIWREDVKRWDEEVKPANIREGRALQQEDIAAMSTAQLVDHLRRAAAFAEQTTYWHHRFNATTVVPVGDFLAHVMDWTGLAAPEILPAFKGLSPDSAGATAELAEVKRTVLADGAAFQLLMSGGDAAAVLQGLRDWPAPVGPAIAAYLDVVGWRILGAYDVCEPHALQHPDLLVRIIRATVTEDETIRRTQAADRVAALRARVPPQHHAEFDALFEEARFVYRLRDERNFYADALGAGLMRRAILEAGARLARDGRIQEPDHLIDASMSEMIALLEGAATPSASELAERARYRREASLDDAPQRLGIPPSAPPPLEWLPPAARRLQRSIDIVLALMFEPSREAATAPTMLKGNPASAGMQEGLARVVSGPTELPSVRQGEILVTPATGPTFNVVLPLVSAIVTERGGALSHAAIVAREYGIPAVVGCLNATKTIKTGSRVRVNGDSGEIWILE